MFGRCIASVLLSLSLSGCTNADTQGDLSLILDSARDTILGDLEEQKKLQIKSSTDDDIVDECHLSDTETCEISTLSNEHTTLIYTGGDTRCIFADSSPYSFQVVRGDPKKVLFYFAGGGACWNEASTGRVPLCSTNTGPSTLDGIFSRDPEANPAYYDHTFIQVLYCSGDVHSGNVTRPYNEHGTDDPVVQVGAINTMAVLDWLDSQNLVLDEFILGGTSAGSVAAQVWADYILSRVSATNSATLFDSFAGVFPPGAVGPMVKVWGICNTILYNTWSTDLQTKCVDQELTLQDLVINALVNHPEQTFTHVNSKTDWIQQAYYIMIGGLNATLNPYITPILYYQQVNEIFEQYHTYPNHVAFLVDASKHVYTNNNLFFSADTNGMSGSDGVSEKLMNWVTALPLGSAKGDSNLTWACAGDEMTVDEAVAEEVRPHAYCDSALTDRVIYAP